MAVNINIMSNVIISQNISLLYISEITKINKLINSEAINLFPHCIVKRRFFSTLHVSDIWWSNTELQLVFLFLYCVLVVAVINVHVGALKILW